MIPWTYKSLIAIGVLLCAAAAQAAPACANRSSDPDGDGWGWENNKSCRVVTGSHPLCSSAAMDSDGDGWGWERSKSCLVVDSPYAGTPICSSAAVDPDGDGWGWEDSKSCIVVKPSAGAAPSSAASPVGSAMAVVAAMGPGWNLGNTLDAFGSETNWGNPKTTKAMIDAVRRAGFTTLRVPVTWDPYMSGNNRQIASWWLDRVEEVVKYGLDNGMHVIVNVHHSNGWQATTASNQAQAMDTLTKLWQQIATRFKGYDQRLVFETMNEPRNGDDWWGKQEYFDVVNNLNAAALSTIRRTGGHNAKRLVMLPGYCASANEMHLGAIKLPNDTMIAVSTHAYFPFDFSMDTTKSGAFSDTAAVDDVFKRLNQRFVVKGIPVVMGEWAATNKGNLADRMRHAEHYARAAQNAKIPVIWWDNANTAAWSSDAMGLLNRNNGTWVFPEIVSAIMRGAK